MSIEKDLLFEYKQAKEKCEDAKKHHSEAVLKFEEAQSRLVEHMEDSGITSTAKYDGIGQVTLKAPVLSARFEPEDSLKVFEFLRDEGLDDVIKETVHHSTLSSFIAQKIRDGQAVPEFFKFSYRKIVQFNKA